VGAWQDVAVAVQIREGDFFGTSVETASRFRDLNGMLLGYRLPWLRT
jgi:hypothetical protein